MTPTNSLHSVTVEKNNKVYKVSRSEGASRDVFHIECYDLDSGVTTIYTGAGDFWQRTAPSRKGRQPVDVVLNQALQQELREVTKQATSELPT